MIHRIIKVYIVFSFVLIVAILMSACTSSTTTTDIILKSDEVSDTISLSEESDVYTENKKDDNDIIRVRVIEFPPFYYNNDKEWMGLEVELANALIKEAKFRAEYIVLPWSRALKAMEIGESDLMMNLVKTPEREEFMNFIGPIRSSQMKLVVHEDYSNQVIETIEDIFEVSNLIGLPIGLQKDVKYPAELASKLDDDSYVKYMDFSYSSKLYPSNVREKRIFGFVEDEIAMNYQLAYNPDYSGLVLHSFVFSEDDIYAGISKHLDDEKYDRLVSAYNILKKNGVFTKIINKYQ